MNDSKFYCYFLINSLDDSIFYVGKGKDDRMYDHLKLILNNKHYNKYLERKTLKILKNGGYIKYEKFFESENERECLLEEKKKIEEIGMLNLCNLTEGGNGGDTWTKNPNKELIIKKIKEQNTGRKYNQEFKDKVSNGLKNSEKFKKTVSSEEYKNKMSIAIKNSKKCKDYYSYVKENGINSGENNANYGNRWSQEKKDLFSMKKIEYYKTHDAPNKGKKVSEESKLKISISSIGKVVSEETKKKISNTLSNKKYSEMECGRFTPITYTIQNLLTHEIYRIVSVKGVRNFFNIMFGNCKSIRNLFDMKEWNNLIIINKNRNNEV